MITVIMERDLKKVHLLNPKEANRLIEEATMIADLFRKFIPVLPFRL